MFGDNVSVPDSSVMDAFVTEELEGRYMYIEAVQNELTAGLLGIVPMYPTLLSPPSTHVCLADVRFGPIHTS